VTDQVSAHPGCLHDTAAAVEPGEIGDEALDDKQAAPAEHACEEDLVRAALAA